MKTFSISPQTVSQVDYCGRSDVKPEIVRGMAFTIPKLHSFHLINYEAEIQHGNQIRKLQPGDWIFTPANMTWVYHDIIHGPHLFFHFIYPTNTSLKKIQLPITGNLGQHFQEIWLDGLQVIRDFQSKHSLQNMITAHSFQRLLLKLSILNHQKSKLSTSSADRRSEKAVSAIAQWLRSHYMDPISVKDFSKKYQISKNYLARCFRIKYGASITQYHLKCRMEHALHLIQQNTIPFKAIASETGFRDAHHFNKRIRFYYHASPSHLRAQALKKLSTHMKKQLPSGLRKRIQDLT